MYVGRRRGAVAALLVLTWSPLPAAAAGSPHQDEIQAFATILAMAQTASARCPGVVVNRDMLQKAPLFFHVTAADGAAAQASVALESKRLEASIDGAPSPQAWCAEAFRSYGPGGGVLPDLLAR